MGEKINCFGPGFSLGMLLLQWLLALVSPSCEASKKFTLESPKASEVDLHAYYLHPNGNYMYLMPMSLHRYVMINNTVGIMTC